MADKQQAQHADRRAEKLSQIVYLDPSEIKVDDTHNPRRYPTVDIDSMVRSLLERGQEVPIKVVATADDTFLLRWGGRRWRAAVTINQNKLYDPEVWPHGMRLASVVVTDPAPAKNKAARAERGKLDLVAAITENVERRDMSAPDKAYAMLRLKTEFGMSQKDIADTFGCSDSMVSRLLDLSRLAEYGLLGESAQRLVHNDSLPWRTAADAMTYGGLAEQALGLLVESCAQGQSWSDDRLRAEMRQYTDQAGETAAGQQDEPATAGAAEDESSGQTGQPAAATTRQRKSSASTTTQPAEPHIKPRTAKEILADIQDYCDKWEASAEEDAEKPGSVILCGHLARYVRGTVGFRYVANRLKEVYEES
jgi:hypothetical protein